ncbi:hypothetical protein OG948_41885 (plasmid) [Embleya sp. NBC_00888]|uniref:hypothetical protein n=1 Tax=Embleya sp. NBC_00888 TaxID=2975960 RepID=UPI002F90C0AC|nr:hypothetical protein OG948_41885 [Embleya sp. NBC_00888]
MTARRRTAAALTTGLAVLGLAGCASSGKDPVSMPTPEPTRSQSATAPPVERETEVNTEAVAFRIRASTPVQPTTAPATEGCAQVVVRLGDVTIESNSTQCKAQTQAPGNGRHGMYRTAADVPAGAATETIRTPLGDAILFTQRYFEATNSVTYWNEPVAIVTLRNPKQATHPTLILRSDKGKLDQAALRTFVETKLSPSG